MQAAEYEIAVILLAITLIQNAASLYLAPIQKLYANTLNGEAFVKRFPSNTI